MLVLRLAATLVVVLSVELSTAHAQRAVPSGEAIEGTLSFDGRATPGKFTGTTSTLTGQITGGADLASVRGWVEAPVKSLKTGDDRRDRDLNKSMESDKYPTMRFDLERVRPGRGAGDTMSAMLGGRLTIHGITREVELPARIVLTGDRARVRSDFPLNLKDYKIGGLTKLFGMLRMYEDIVVHVDVTFALRPSARAPQASPSEARTPEASAPEVPAPEASVPHRTIRMRPSREITTFRSTAPRERRYVALFTPWGRPSGPNWSGRAGPARETPWTRGPAVRQTVSAVDPSAT